MIYPHHRVEPALWAATAGLSGISRLVVDLRRWEEGLAAIDLAGSLSNCRTSWARAGAQDAARRSASCYEQ